MNITDLLTITSIDLDAKVSSKEEAIDHLVDLMMTTGKINNRELYRKDIFSRESQGSTGVGEGIAIPHAQSEAVDDFALAAMVVKDGVDNKKSIYQIVIENKDTINKSVTTLYRYINNGYLTTKRTDLPYAVVYKKRKHNKKYEYSENNKIDRTGHTYIDYLAYLHKNPGIYVWQLDFLGSIKTDNNNILSFILPNLQFVLLDLRTKVKQV